MTFDISQLDNIEFYDSDESLKKLEEYQDHILDDFMKSEEGASLLENSSGIGFWTGQLIYYGYSHIGVSLASMEVRDIEEILNDLFPRKISLQSPDDANEIIPELLAFWRFAQKEYGLDQSNKILNYLYQLENNYFQIMNDSSRYGLAKSMMMRGSESGFDMTNPDEANQFINIFNQNLAASPMDIPFGDSGPDSPAPGPSRSKKAQSKKVHLKRKKLRKMKKASRKKNKKRN